MTKEFLAGVKTEGLVSMLKQHIISDWGGEQVDISYILPQVSFRTSGSLPMTVFVLCGIFVPGVVPMTKCAM